mgnify:CR=1 FL=1
MWIWIELWQWLWCLMFSTDVVIAMDVLFEWIETWWWMWMHAWEWLIMKIMCVCVSSHEYLVEPWVRLMNCWLLHEIEFMDDMHEIRLVLAWYCLYFPWLGWLNGLNEFWKNWKDWKAGFQFLSVIVSKTGNFLGRISNLFLHESCRESNSWNFGVRFRSIGVL